jgi:hypothetical protein
VTLVSKVDVDRAVDCISIVVVVLSSKRAKINNRKRIL